MTNQVPLAGEMIDDVFRRAEQRLRRSRGRLARSTDSPTLEMRVGTSVAEFLEGEIDQVAKMDDEYLEWFRSDFVGRLTFALRYVRLAQHVATYVNRRTVQIWHCGETVKPRLTALLELHAYSIVVTSEITLLISHGFPAGAEARWRTLHELGVIVRVLARRGQSLSKRYLDSHLVQMKQELDSGSILGLEGARSGEEDALAKEITARAEEAASRHGPDFMSLYGWARPVIPNGRLTFRALEEAAKQNHRRPAYTFASSRVHAGRWGSLSALVTDEEGRFLVGPRRRGLYWPMLKTIWTANEITGFLLDEVVKASGLDEPRIWDECHTQLSAEADLWCRRAGMTAALEDDDDDEALRLQSDPRVNLMMMMRARPER